MDLTDTRQHVHDLVDQLAPAQLVALKGLLSAMIDPVTHSIRSAPFDDEPVTQEEAVALRRSAQWFRQNEGIPIEEVLSEFGLSMKDFPLANRAD